MTDDHSTMTSLLCRWADSPQPAMRFEDATWTYAELVRLASDRAAFLVDNRLDGPLHVGVLLDNVPEFAMWLGACALSGGVVVGINPTRRGDELGRDIRHADCQLIITDSTYRPLLDGIDLGVSDDRILVTDSEAYDAALEPYAGASRPAATVEPSVIYLLLFTSGTSGAPKAVICTQGRLARIGTNMAERSGLTPDDVCYLAMPMFHSNALMAGWAPAIAAGATVALRRRFSASGFLPDVRRFGVTYFNYVGKPLAYILATPEGPDDADNPLRLVFGNEGAEADLGRFSRRFACPVIDAYGSTEGGASVGRTPDTPAGALGPTPEGMKVLDPVTGEECAVATFDDNGRLTNADEAVGEMVNTLGAGLFEGYYDNDEANQARVRDGYYWTGDLAYRDEQGYLYFAGRDFEWLRVDGENFAAAPVERILNRHPDVVLAAVYAVPDATVGDQVMAALQLRPGAEFDASGFQAFLATQPDLGTKWAPRFVRVTDRIPVTQTNKVLKRMLRRERWECADQVWWRPSGGEGYRPLVADDVAALRSEFERRERIHVLDAV